MKKKWIKLKRNLKKAPLSSYVAFSITVVIIYTIVCTVLTATTGNDYSSLYTVFCGIFGGELLVTAMIQIWKLKGKNDGVDGE